MMTLEEEGAYIRLISYCWRHGSVPSDPEQAARLIGKGASTTLAAAVLTMFTPGSLGRLVHDRLEHERQKQAVWREKSAAGGRKSAELRKGGSTTVQPHLKNGANQKATLRTPSPSPSSVSDSVSPDKTVGRAKALPDDEWIASLSINQAFEGIDVEREIAKCRLWCENKRKSCSRQRIINWLNRTERPISGVGKPASEWERKFDGLT